MRMRSETLARIATLAFLVSFGTSPAFASTASEEQQGAALMRAINTEARACKSLGSKDFERIGEYAMGLNFASTGRHDAMNRRMEALMGAQGERQAHEAMGKTYSGCVGDGRNDQSGFGMMGGYESSGPGMMGGSAYGPGMMSSDTPGAGNGSQAAADGQGMSVPAAVLLAVIAAALGAALSALVMPRLAGRGPRVPRTS